MSNFQAKPNLTTDLKAGDWVKIPKGTGLMDYSRPTDEVTKRDVVVQLKGVDFFSNWWLYISDLHQDIYRKEIYNFWQPLVPPAEAQAKEELLAGLVLEAEKKFGPLYIVSWGNNKYALIKGVERTEAPAPRKVSEPKVNLRQQMVAKSRWKFTQDHDIKVQITNPERGKEMDVWEKANPHPKQPPEKRVMLHGRPAIIMPSNNDPIWAAYYDAREKWDAAREVERKAIHARHTAEVDHVLFSVKAGDIFEVTGKFTTYATLGREWLKGQFCPVKFDGGKVTKLPYSDIKDVIEADTIPTVDIYVFRDKDTGLFMQTYPYGNSVYEWDRDDKGEFITHPVHGHRMGGYYVYQGMKNKPEMTDKFMKAKHFDSMGRLKTSILQATGYYDGLNTDAIDNSRGYDTSYEKQMDLPENWEVVKFDKLARKEVEVIDIQAWYKRAYELRELTLRFGSSVRTVYKDLEKRDELDAQKGVIVFTVPQAQKDEGLDYDDKTAFTKEQLESIDDLIERLGMKKGSFRRGKDAFTQSISFKDKGTALMAKLSYSGNLKISVLDLETLKEAVDD